MCSTQMADKIRFIILKINGNDVSHLPGNDMVQMFLRANEPILIEVKRKLNCNSEHIDDSIKSTGKRAELSLNEQLETLEISSNSEVRPTICNLTSNSNIPTFSEIGKELCLALNPEISVQTELVGQSKNMSTQTDDILFEYQNHSSKGSDRVIEEEHNLFEQCLAPDIDIEEITLRKSNSNERLGLTVCYSGCSNSGVISGLEENEVSTEVFISDIMADSIAGRDGRLRQGDQILQINGKDIKTKDETETLIAENTNAVTLLISRYLYTDEDFNDPSVADLDVDEDDDDEDEFYDDSNFTYENCLMENDYRNTGDDLDKMLLVRTTQRSSPDKTSATQEENHITNTTDTLLIKDKNHPLAAIKEMTGKKRKPVGEIDQSFNLPPNKEYNVKLNASKDLLSEKPLITAVNKNISVKLNPDYETEHIYETIPEDSESEPFYCSPYESSNYVLSTGTCPSVSKDVQKQRVAQWLGIKANSVTVGTMSTTSPKQIWRNGSNCGRSLGNEGNTFSRNRSETIRSVLTTVTNGSSSSGGGGGVGTGGGIGICSHGSNNNIAHMQSDDHDNSSSAYNTGGSNNSVAPLSLVLNQNEEEDGQKHGSRCCKMQRLPSPKEKIVSPKNTAISLNKTANGSVAQASCAVTEYQEPEILVRMSATTSTMDAMHCSPKTIFGNEGNLLQTMLLQQKMLKQQNVNQQQIQQRQCQQTQADQMQYLTQFNAPNLSQYHFVSSQEQVKAAHLNPIPTAVVVAHNHSNEETMVWKVKRRQDGTRYIVRRPARNRLLRDRTIRLNTERIRNDLTTTEEDTISEVKMGKYWSKEERKKHIERARERRQQHQQHIETSTIRVSDKVSTRLQQHYPRDYFPQRFHRQNSTKVLQQHQLQFSSSTGIQLHPSSSTINVEI